MGNIIVKIILPTGTTSDVELPDDVPIVEWTPELVTALALPTLAADGQPMSYVINSKELGRQLHHDETLAATAVTTTPQSFSANDGRFQQMMDVGLIPSGATSGGRYPAPVQLLGDGPFGGVAFALDVLDDRHHRQWKIISLPFVPVG